jgi:hypothetical protein
MSFSPGTAPDRRDMDLKVSITFAISMLFGQRVLQVWQEAQSHMVFDVSTLSR